MPKPARSFLKAHRICASCACVHCSERCYVRVSAVSMRLNTEASMRLNTEAMKAPLTVPRCWLAGPRRRGSRCRWATS